MEGKCQGIKRFFENIFKHPKYGFQQSEILIKSLKWSSKSLLQWITKLGQINFHKKPFVNQMK